MAKANDTCGGFGWVGNIVDIGGDNLLDFLNVEIGV
jgi:hypothetical protein